MKERYRECIQNKKVTLKRVDSNIIPVEYLSFLNDPEVTKFLQARFKAHDESTIKQFVESFDHQDNFLFGIWSQVSAEFIGTITLRVDPNHRFSSLGYMIGNRSYWDGETAIAACTAVLDFAFFERRVRKIIECTTENHIASNFNFRRLGFTMAAKIPDLYWGNGKYHAGVYWTLDSDTWARRRNSPTPEIPNPKVV